MNTPLLRIVVLLLVIALTGCPSRSDQPVVHHPGDGDRTTQGETVTLPPTDSGWEPLRTVKGEPLSESEIASLLSRLPEFESREEDEVTFKRRAESMPPPLTGETLQGEWPPDLSAPRTQPAPDGPLQVQAFRPTGEVRSPFQVAIAFDRPVVAVGAVGTQTIPDVSLSPAVEGRWRWLGTQTLVFEPASRWPDANEFTVQLKAGLTAVDGKTLGEDLSFGFATPAPQAQAIYPPSWGPQPADAPVVVVFNQAIDQAKTAEAVEVRAGRRTVAARLLSGEAAKEAAKRWNAQAAFEEGRVVVLAPAQDYPDAATVTVNVAGPLVSSEGPVIGTQTMSSSFQVRGAFNLSEIRCGWDRECRPGTPIQLFFTNPIAQREGAIDVTVTPEVQNLSVQNHGSVLTMTGDFKPRTSYSFEVPADLKDAFDQSLQGRRTRSINVGSHPPMVAGPNQTLIVRPSSMSATLPIMVAELARLRVRVYSATPDDWAKFTLYQSSRSDDLDLPVVSTETLRFGRSERQERQELDLDLSAAFAQSATGHVVVVIDEPSPWARNQWGPAPRWVYWVQRTDLSADLTSDFREINTRITTLSDGRAVQGASLEFGARRHETDEQGEVRLDLSAYNTERPIVVRHGEDSLLIPTNGQTHWFNNQRWSTTTTRNQPLWYIVDDRQMYKPGETVKIRGWLRTLRNEPRSTPALPAARALDFKVFEPRRNEIAQGRVRLDRFGGFEFEFDIPEGANLGHAQVQLTGQLGDGTRLNTQHGFQIQEFRRPEYEVKVSTDAGPHMVGEETIFIGEAAYFAGGALVGAQSGFRFTETSASFRPAGWSDWSFGAWNPWWFSAHYGGHYGHSGHDHQVLPEALRAGFNGQTDGSGRFAVPGQFLAPERGLPRQVTAHLSVTDVNRQTWQASDSVLVHPAAAYVGLRTEKTFIHRDESWEVEAIAVDLDGKVQEGLAVELALFEQRGWGASSTRVEECTRTSKEEAVRCEFKDLAPGSYRVIATVTDEQGRTSESELSFWVAGQDRRGAQTAEEGRLLLIPDKDEYRTGDTASLFVQAPYYPLDAVVELRRDGRLERKHVTVSAENPVVEIPIDIAMVPNVHVSVIAQGREGAYAADAFAAGTINLQVSRDAHRLGVRINPAAESIAPGATVGIEVEVQDPQGRPLKDAEVLLFAVDEAILGLSNYALGDPLSFFFPERAPQMTDVRSRAWLLLEADDESMDSQKAQPEEQIMMDSGAVRRESAPAPRSRQAPARGAAGLESLEEASGAMPMAVAMNESAQQQAEPINLREVFDALAFFHGGLTTDEQGRVLIEATMPESLTRYRIMAVAVHGAERSGTGEADITARMPLMVRPSEPRFLNVDDQFEFSVVLQNQTAEPMTVDVALRATSNLRWLEAPGRRVEVPAADRVEVRWRAQARSAGSARVEIVGASGPHGDAALATFPILTPATTEAFATYGSLSDVDAVLEALQIPRDAYSEFGGLDIQTSSTQLQALTDALIYLTTYRFNCSEQLASRILSVLALYDVLEAFNAPDLPSPETLRAHLQIWVDELVRNQRSDGGFGFWSSSRHSSPWVTTHATYALWMAQQHPGVNVPPRVIPNANRFLSGVRNHLSQHHKRSAATVEAYALYVRHRAGLTNARELDALVTHYGIEELSLEAMGWLLPLAKDTRWEQRFMERITGQVQETSATAEFQERYSAGSHLILHTTRRTDGVVLDGLLQVEPDHYLIEKVVRGLMAHRSRGRWANTQENVFILMALRRYFDVYETDEPDFISRAWLGEEHILEHSFKGRTTERSAVHVPMSFLHEGDDLQPVVLQRDGTGRMYYRMGVRYAPKSRHLPSLNEGFQIERVYQAVDDPDDVVREEDGSWTVRAGARVRIELTMTVPARRYHVALIDWLPAGFEAINTALAVSDLEAGLAGGSSDRRSWWGWWGWPWYEHQNMRDERVEAFAALISEGVYTYSYVARATIPGEFIAMPAKAEEMYHPETFGRSATEVVRVVDAR